MDTSSTSTFLPCSTPMPPMHSVKSPSAAITAAENFSGMPFLHKRPTPPPATIASVFASTPHMALTSFLKTFLNNNTYFVDVKS